tara:strand:- start:9048 stop:9779 length:732 start_codon:yes stop_codon:yes gene_type:complete
MNFTMGNNMFVFKYFPLILIIMSSVTWADSTHVYFSEVIAIDRNNIMTVLKNGKRRLIKLAYLRTPIKNEYKNKIVHQYLNDILLNRWVRVSELSGTGRAKVYRAILRDENQKYINVVVAAKGYGVPVKIEQPPQSIFDASKIAKKHKKGVWDNEVKFSEDITNTQSKSFLSYLDKVQKTIEQQKNSNNQIFVGNKESKSFTPLKCASKFDKKDTVIFATKHVGLHRNYLFVPCPENKASPTY